MLCSLLVHLISRVVSIMAYQQRPSSPKKVHMWDYAYHKMHPLSRACFAFSPLIDSVRDLQSPPDLVTDQNEEQFYTLGLLKLIFTECCAPIQQNQREKISLCWTRVARIINVTFLALYIITITVFLSVLGKLWFYT